MFLGAGGAGGEGGEMTIGRGEGTGGGEGELMGMDDCFGIEIDSDGAGGTGSTKLGCGEGIIGQTHSRHPRRLRKL